MQFFGYTGRNPKIKEINAEIELMKNLEGIDGMVQMHGVFMDTAAGIIPGKLVTASSLPVIIMELLEGGELFERIADRETFSENNIAKIFKGIVLAMDSMHERRYIHRKFCEVLLLYFKTKYFLFMSYFTILYIL